MAIPSRQIGWGTEENLLWEISKQLELLTNVTAKTCANNAPTYKVFTALLTQNGESNTSYLYIGTSYGNTLTIGVSYTIEGNNNTDFTNVGAPNNNIGTSFIATGTTPNNQSNNDETYLSFDNGAPVAIVLENTIGDIYFTYVIDGIYNANLLGAFDPEKTFVTISNPNSAYVGSPGVCDTSVSIDVVQINTFDSGFLSANNQLYLNSIEIRVYN